MVIVSKKRALAQKNYSGGGQTPPPCLFRVNNLQFTIYVCQHKQIIGDTIYNLQVIFACLKNINLQLENLQMTMEY